MSIFSRRKITPSTETFNPIDNQRGQKLQGLVGNPMTQAKQVTIEDVCQIKEMEHDKKRKEIIDKFNKGLNILYNNRNKGNFKTAKKWLFDLNKSLNKFDTNQKNHQDNVVYKKKSDLNQAYHLVYDIFDNFRFSDEIPIYTKEQTEDIFNTLKMIDSLVNLDCIKELLGLLECL